MSRSSPGACWWDSACGHLPAVAEQAQLQLFPSPVSISVRLIMSPLQILISILHLCLPLQPHPMIVDHSLQPFSELERDGGHHKTLVRHKLCLPFLPGCDLPWFSKLNSRSSQNVKPVFSLHSLNDILVISIFWFWLTPGSYHYQRKSQDQVMGGFKVFKVLPVCVDKSNNVRLVSKLCFDLGHLSSLSLDSINQSMVIPTAIYPHVRVCTTLSNMALLPSKSNSSFT